MTVSRWIAPFFSPTFRSDLARAILDKADGNPFFLEELCRAVEEDDRDGGPAVPDTIQDVLIARVQRLPDVARRLLQAASVLGRDVSIRLLGAIWPEPAPIESALSTLTSLEFLYPRSGEGESVYVFKHALTQEVAYGTLGAADRRALHAAAGRALERFYAGRLQEVYDRLAYHYARTDDTARAVEYLVRFAEKSARAYAHEEAVKALTEALTRVEDLPVEARDRSRLEVVLHLPPSLLPLGRINEIFTMLLPEADRLARLDDPALGALYHYLLGRAYILGRHELAVEHARRSIAHAERASDKATMGKAYSLLAVAGALSGQALGGLEDGTRAVRLLENTPEQSSLSYAYWALGLCQCQIGAFDDARIAHGRALQIAEAIGDLPMEASATWGLAVIDTAVGKWDDGIAASERAVRAARDALNRAITTGMLGFACLEKGDTARARSAFEQSIPLLHRFGLRAFEAWFTALLGEAHRVEGQLDRAYVLASQAVEIAMEAKFGIALGWAQFVLARIAAARDELDAAAARFGEALATFTAIHSRYEVARVRMDLGLLCRARGDRETAHRHLSEAQTLFEVLGVPLYRERAERLARSVLSEE